MFVCCFLSYFDRRLKQGNYYRPHLEVSLTFRWLSVMIGVYQLRPLTHTHTHFGDKIMAKQSKTEKNIDRRVEMAYSQTCGGIQIMIMDTMKVLDVGRQACLLGQDDEALRHIIRSFVETIRKN